jgi:hypothetical protein
LWLSNGFPIAFPTNLFHTLCIGGVICFQDIFFRHRGTESTETLFSKIGRCRFLKVCLPAAPGEPHVREATGCFSSAVSLAKEKEKFSVASVPVVNN